MQTFGKIQEKWGLWFLYPKKIYFDWAHLQGVGKINDFET